MDNASPRLNYRTTF